MLVMITQVMSSISETIKNGKFHHQQVKSQYPVYVKVVTKRHYTRFKE